MDFWGFTIQVIGEILIALTVLKVHHKMLEDKKLDSKVIDGIRIEQHMGIFGIALIILGYLMQII